MTTHITAGFTALYTAITGLQAGAPQLQALEDVILMAGGEDQFPHYLCSIMEDLGAGQPDGPKKIPAQEQDSTWLLGELTPVLPGTELLNEAEKDIFTVPALHLAAVITRSEATYSIVTWPVEAAQADKLIVLNNFDPTPEQVRTWAYSPDMRLVSQDEVAVLGHVNYIPLLIELAADKACPKRTYILAIADGYVAGVRRGGYDRNLLQKAHAQAARSSLPDLQSWATDLACLLEYVEGKGPVTVEMARIITRIVLTGRYRAALTVKEQTVPGWWQFAACFPDDGVPLDWLFISQPSGALVWSEHHLDGPELAPHAHAAKRDDPLRKPV